MKYTLDFFENNDFKYVLTQEIIDSINFLAKKVGAPTYIKTPNFKKKTKSNWESLRNFKITKLEVKDAKLTEISQLLNKRLFYEFSVNFAIEVLGEKKIIINIIFSNIYTVQ